MKIFMTVIVLGSFAMPLTAQWAQYRTPSIPRTADGKPNLAAPAPRSADGHPDLTGLWETIGAGAISENAVSGISSPPTFSRGRKSW